MVFGVNDGQTKYMWFSDDDYEFLFDVQNDPHDLHDLSANPAWRDVLGVQRQRIIDWMTENDDPHVTDGKLNPTPRAFDAAAARAKNGWNNRGRH